MKFINKAGDREVPGFRKRVPTPSLQRKGGRVERRVRPTWHHYQPPYRVQPKQLLLVNCKILLSDI
ncbi:MAG TPA: hypothetical protein VK971_14065, partial [Thiohalobacter sp.]|nr:hypothetical protein [Thiohalobacter sp.]